MPRKVNDDNTLIKSLKDKLRKVEKQRSALTKQLNILQQALELLENSDSGETTSIPKTKKIKQGTTIQSRVVDVVVELSEKTGGPVGIKEILTALSEKGIVFEGRTDHKTRISGILNREHGQNGKARVKKVGRGLYAKA